jgi:ABC-type dipeptide/oligopeptide/nickel transport system permease subunit/outer membrane protein assembly factor BamB
MNWPLLLGSVLVLLLAVLAIKGPEWAPQDPMKENYALSIDGRIVRPPYPAFRLPEFPLGTDQFGRDLISRILWGIRPTLSMVVIVAAVRLLAGILMGLLIGWSSGRAQRWMDNALSMALAIPVLIVALMGITAVGIQKGLPAFIAGLALTGWAETARLVSEQTRTLKSQTFIEAARALGASDRRILFVHILTHITPLAWMLMAFEISSTMVVVAELGFLGYYIGGGSWIEISDFAVVNTTGLPELGQMLATVLINLVNPMPMIVVGGVVFLIIFGFNLLGEGLRLRLQRQVEVGWSRPRWMRGAFGDWLDVNVKPIIQGWLEIYGSRLAWISLIIAIVFGWTVFSDLRPQNRVISAQTLIIVPGGHLWASERHDAQGTRWTDVQGPDAPVIQWIFNAPGGFDGGPVVSAEGTIYVASLEGRLIALNPDASIRWEAELVDMPVGTPALGAQGQIYVALNGGGLSAFTAEGQKEWDFIPQSTRKSTSGPVVSSSGLIYYTRVERVQAVRPDGQELWYKIAKDDYLEVQPSLSAGESFLFLLDVALSAENGFPVVLEGLPMENFQFTLPAFFAGANGKSYLRTSHTVFGWRSTAEGVVTDLPVTWDYEGQVLVPPVEQGVTPGGLYWLFYAGDYFDTRIVWLDQEGRLLNNIRPADRQSKLVAIDRRNTMYYCSNNFNLNLNCVGIALGSPQPDWSVSLGENDSIAGAALLEDRLLVTTANGVLYALGDGR